MPFTIQIQANRLWCACGSAKHSRRCIMISRRSWHGDSAPPRTSEAGCSFGAKPVFLRLGKPKPLAFMRHMLFDFCLTTCGLHGSWKSWMFKQTIYLYVYIYIRIYQLYNWIKNGRMSASHSCLWRLFPKAFSGGWPGLFTQASGFNHQS